MITCVTAPLRCRRLRHQDRQGDWSLPPTARAVEFRKFLDTIEAEVPADLDVHLIADNYATHKTALIRNWFAKRPRFHMHFTPKRLVAEPGGALVRSAHRKAVAPRRASEQSRTGDCHLPLPGRRRRCLDQDRRPNPGQRRPANFEYRTLETWPETPILLRLLFS